MATRQYIGARYVPILANPVEWSSTNTYEPLTIVTYQGNSYTSRQFVPASIDINNTSYWAETGNYNAQVEQYRQEVLHYAENLDSIVESIDTLDENTQTSLDNIREDITTLNENTQTSLDNIREDITTLNEKTINICSIQNYGCKPNQTNDYNTAIQQIAAICDYIYIPTGTWLVNEPIVIPQNIKGIFSNGGCLKATTAMECIVSFAPVNSFIHIDGVIFNGNNRLIDYLFYCPLTSDLGNPFVFDNCTFLNYFKYGIYTQLLGLTVRNCVFKNVNTIEGQEHADSIGCVGTTDSIIIGCKCFGNYALAEIAGGIVSNCYVWCGHLENAYVCKKGSQSSMLSILQCEIDCIGLVTNYATNTMVQLCRMYWNDEDRHTDCYLFNSEAGNYENIDFSNNQILYNSKLDLYSIHMFRKENIDNNAILLYHYHSVNNIIYFSYGTAYSNLSHYRMLIGYAQLTNDITGGIIFKYDENNLNSIAPYMHLKFRYDNQFELHGNKSHYHIMQNPLAYSSYTQNVYTELLPESDRKRIKYINYNPMSIKEIEIIQCPVFDIEINTLPAEEIELLTAADTYKYAIESA